MWRVGGSVGREAMISAGSGICHLPCEGWEVSVDVAEGPVVALIVDAAAMSGRRVERLCR